MMFNATRYGSLNSEEDIVWAYDAEDESFEPTRATRITGWVVTMAAIVICATIIAFVPKHNAALEAARQPHIIMFTVDDMGKKC